MSEEEFLELKRNIEICKELWVTHEVGAYTQQLQNIIRNVYKDGFNKGIQLVINELEKIYITKN